MVKCISQVGVLIFGKSASRLSPLPNWDHLHISCLCPIGSYHCSTNSWHLHKQYSEMEVWNKTSGHLSAGHNCWRYSTKTTPHADHCGRFPFGLIDLMYFHKSWPKASTFQHLKFNFLKPQSNIQWSFVKKNLTHISNTNSLQHQGAEYFSSLHWRWHSRLQHLYIDIGGTHP